jgi:hypothetical protein
MNRNGVTVRIAKRKKPAEWSVSGRQHNRYASFHHLTMHGIRIGRGHPERDAPAELAGCIQVDHRSTDCERDWTCREDDRPWRVLGQRFQSYFLDIECPGCLKIMHLESKKARACQFHGQGVIARRCHEPYIII